jgi:DNA-binding LytR/AlgR family response regulator
MKEKILIIEDDKSYLENIITLLEEEGFESISAVNGFDGIDAARNEKPDLIICDIMLPDIDGHSILKELRRREKTKLIPFIFLTAKASMSDLRTGMNLGADDYLPKPFRAIDLLTAIRARIDKAKLVIDNTRKDETSNKQKLGIEDYLFLPYKNNYEVLPVKNVLFISSEGVYSNVYTVDGKKILMRKLLKDWEKTLPDVFLRIHKSSIVNIKCIKKIEKWFNGALKIYLNHYSDSLIVSRRYASHLKKINK